MATTALSATSPTVLDLAKRTMDGSIVPVVEALTQKNSFLASMEWKEGNLDTGHRVASRTALPTVSWVRINEGVAPSKSLVDTYDEACGMLEGLSSIDEKLLMINKSQAGYRSSEDDSFLAQMSNTLETAFFYESTKANPERIMGLAPRLALTTSAYGKQIVKADTFASSGASSGNDQTSVWLLGWGPRSVYGISPRGMGMGLKMEDMGRQRVLDSNNNVLWKYETKFHWNAGFCVEDYRNVVRLCNVDTGGLTFDAATGVRLLDAMIVAYYQMGDMTSTRPAWYCNRLVGAFLHRQAVQATKNSVLSIEPNANSPGVFGKPIAFCLGAPIYITDALTNTEAPVT